MTLLRLLLQRLPLVATIVLCACAEPDTEDDPIENFTRTSQSGQVLSDDTNDWRIAARFAGEIELIQVAFPNPTRNGQVQLTIQFRSTVGFPRIDFLAVTRDGVPVNYPVILETDFNVPNFGAKTYLLDLVKISPNRNIAQLRGRLFRVRVIDAVGNIITYGDIFIE